MTRIRLPGQFASDRRGNVAMIFGIAVLPMMAIGGAAVDYGLATRLEARLQAATDATALRLCQMDPVTSTLTILQTSADALMKGFMDGTVVTVDPLTLIASPRKIRVTARATAPTYFGKFTGLVTPKVAASAQCATGSDVPQDYEIALVIDTTGSMNNSAGTQTKMEAARDAGRDFITSVFTDPGFGPKTKMSLVPFAASVAVPPATYRYANWIDTAGASRYHWVNVEKRGAGFNSRFDIFDRLATRTASWAWAGCLETQTYPANVQDGYSTATDSLHLPMFAPDEPDSTSINDYLDDYKPFSISDFFTPNTCPNTAVAGYTIQDEARACKYKDLLGPKVKLAAGTSSANGPNYMCTSQPLQTLTRDSATLTAQVATLVPRGSTNIHQGLMWGWRTISPFSVLGQGSSYSSGINKAIVLMTDGANTWESKSTQNNSTFSSLGFVTNADGSSAQPRLPPNQALTDNEGLRDALDALTAQGCANAKAAGVTIYTVAFSTPGDAIDTKGITMLAACASPGKAFVANDATAVKAAFRKIYTSVGKLRLTQ